MIPTLLISGSAKLPHCLWVSEVDKRMPFVKSWAAKIEKKRKIGILRVVNAFELTIS